ncbi:unnamed protein product [Arctia plantaginis]|uniref:BPTI/Kunitz inhibitor domain-containing protein n=1 Tax=Arctia plantaginis TaxID=874455 RepID=A0A8S1BHU6_ARCPL|nr:unnamed protein product [Arctia plantaginis]
MNIAVVNGVKYVGAGQDSAPIPPWGYSVQNIGKPPDCLLQVLAGFCRYKESIPEKRFAYNPYIDECVEFEYSGCEGNTNNFSTELQCQQYCMAAPSSGCREKTDIVVNNALGFYN